MGRSSARDAVVATSVGDVTLQECRLRLAGREWSLLHTSAVLSHEEEREFLGEREVRMPYGVVLWPAAIALAHELATRGDALQGTTVLELGAGTGLPGIVASSFGARVTQTDRQELAMLVCRRNGERNGVRTIEYHLADWSAWNGTARYDWIIGSDILYGETMHPHLQRIFETCLAPRGHVLLADPFRATSIRLLESLESNGWDVAMSKWTVGEDENPRVVGVFELTGRA